MEQERERAQLEAERLEAERIAALRAKDELERQAVDQMKSQEQLVIHLFTLHFFFWGLKGCSDGGFFYVDFVFFVADFVMNLDTV